MRERNEEKVAKSRGTPTPIWQDEDKNQFDVDTGGYCWIGAISRSVGAVSVRVSRAYWTRSHPTSCQCVLDGGEDNAGKALEELISLYRDELAGRGLYQHKAKGDSPESDSFASRRQQLEVQIEAWEELLKKLYRFEAESEGKEA